MISKKLLWLLLLATLWGPSFLFIKIAVAEIPPLSMVTVRVGVAALLLFVVVRLQGKRLPAFGGLWLHFFVLGFFAHALPFALLSWGEQHIDSALASILNGTTPLFTILLAHFVIADERMTVGRIVGSILGFHGLALLVYPELVTGISATTLGTLSAVAAALSYAVALVYARVFLRGRSAIVTPTAQLTCATLMLLPLALAIDRPFELAMPSMTAVAAVLALAVAGTAVAFVVYYRLIEIAGPTYLSLVTYLVPVFGVFLGVAVLREDLPFTAYAGCALILLGVMVVNRVSAAPDVRGEPSSGARRLWTGLRGSEG